MSLGYAEKLSYREDLGGQLGAPELFDRGDLLESKIGQLVALVKEASRVVVFTGAGISTACGIPDFRGPNGIWTLQRSKRPLPPMKTSFVAARPSYTHQALVALVRTGKVTYIVSQNVDGLHLRSGVPRSQLSELHGNCFAERCDRCKAEYVRDFEIETVGFKRTGRLCSQQGCGGQLRDHILDWEDALPDDELEAAKRHAGEADLAICLGTSLQITPACNLPLLTVKAGGKMAIVNLQKTPKDKKAAVVIHARCDLVMQRLMAGLHLRAEPYTRRDTVAIRVHQHPPRLRHCNGSAADSLQQSDRGGTASGVAPGAEAGEAVLLDPPRAPAACADGSGSDEATTASASSQQEEEYPFTLTVHNQCGRQWPVPLLESVEFRFEDPRLGAAMKEEPPFRVAHTVQHPGSYPVTITLRLSSAADDARRVLSFPYVVHLVSEQQLLQQDQQDQEQTRQEAQQGQQQRGVTQGARVAEDRPRRLTRASALAAQKLSKEQHEEQVVHETLELVSFVTQEVDYESQHGGGVAVATVLNMGAAHTIEAREDVGNLQGKRRRMHIS